MNSPEITVYEPNYRAKIGFFKIWMVMLRNIIRSRELIWQLFKRDFLMSYKKSFLGMAWIVISPVVGIVSWIFMNFTGVLNPGDVGIPYPAYVLLSSSVWGLFMGFYTAGEGTLAAGAGIITQVQFPHEALLIKQTAHQLANFILGFVLNIIILIAFGVIPSWKIVFFPLVTIPLFLLGAGIGLVVSVIGVVAMDLSKGMTIVLGLVMYITPVIYSNRVDNPFLKTVITYNPLTYLVGNVRDLIIYGRFDTIEMFLYSTLFAIGVFLVSWRFFYLSEDKVVDKMI
ncbi:MAG TPA: ABC transporter permease [Spirochaetota bacterium]|nr:ABC transporter permease [Spirochaetota bacterium]HPC40179.1 ABC transporter permease [Spirochaetota bacterium]HPL17831.1 ABC transporter permease [Spirochaetota bacterium]HQF10612.1 ABC transporter permease [Spirochaetota bacterium]HQJ73166.1 ABC transporter permease [Spirochaetota bacterium]